jgi:glycosyltransferase involved in cell wall biosynthesis
MKILILTPQLPYPPHQGTSLRNYHIIRGLARRHQITLLSLLEAGQTADAETIAPLLDLCVAVETVPAPARSRGRRLWQLAATRRPDMDQRLHSPLFNVALRDLLSRNRFDVVQVEGIELARAMAIIRIVTPRSKILFDDHNAETALQRRALLADLTNPGRWPAAAYSWLQIGRLRRFERWACRQADWVTAVSEADRRHLLALLPSLRTKITVVPNCIDVQQFQSGPAVAEERDGAFAYDLLFTGKMDYRPNVDAVLWFADEVWPRIRQQRPQTTWAIVGQKPHSRLQRVRELADVTVTGWVESVQPYLAGAAVYVMPLRVGSGTRLKLIEAMAAGKAVVSTPIGAEGFPVQHERQVLLAATPAETATAVLRLLDQPEERQRLGEAAQQLAQQYDWRRVIPLFDEVYKQMV